MKSKRLAALISFSLVFTFLYSIAPVTADENGNGRGDRIKCKPSKITAQMPKKVDAPANVLKRIPRFVTLKTNCGDIVIRTYNRQARATLTALATLINANYYDNSACHRLATDDFHVIQCGDPSATGLGDPGFSVRSENLPEATEDNYPKGTVAMSNLGRPRTTGSQFLIFYEDTTFLPANYTIWGEVLDGMEIVEFIAEGGVRGGGSDGMPKRNLVIERILTR
ncbi:MAG: hypothetical protein RLZZ527_935 [Actinomycetota bacterium]|jgi:peptidyl-prolyl cis-trans isomerase B (cyclophilin B)